MQPNAYERILTERRPQAHQPIFVDNYGEAVIHMSATQPGSWNHFIELWSSQRDHELKFWAHKGKKKERVWALREWDDPRAINFSVSSKGKFMFWARSSIRHRNGLISGDFDFEDPEFQRERWIPPGYWLAIISPRRQYPVT